MTARRIKRRAAAKHLAAGHWQSCAWISEPGAPSTQANGWMVIPGGNEQWGVVWSGWSDEQCRRAHPLYRGMTFSGGLIRGEMHVEAPRPKRRPMPPEPATGEVAQVVSHRLGRIRALRASSRE